MNTRPNITKREKDLVLDLIKNSWNNELKNKGEGIFINNYEMLGCLEEEHYELIQAIHRNSQNEQLNEMVDMIIVLAHGIASIYKKMDLE